MTAHRKPDQHYPMTTDELIATGIASVGKPRVAQDVVVSTSVHNGSVLGPRYIVLVTPEGAESGEYYEVYRNGLQALRNGMTPDELELEPYESDDEPEPFGGDYCHADDFRALPWALHLTPLTTGEKR